MKRGFTLIEILVSTALFCVVMVVALGALLALSVSARKAEAISSAVNNLGGAIDSMSRAIRTGYSYDCNDVGLAGTMWSEGIGTTTDDCLPTTLNGTALSFSDANGNNTRYAWCEQSSSGVLGSAPNYPCTACTDSKCGILRSVTKGGAAQPWIAMTAPEVNITNMYFNVIGSAQGSPDNTQPRVVMHIVGTITVTGAQSSTFAIQTSVTQRIFDQ